MSQERSMTRIAVNGAAGRMGRMVLAGVLLDEGLKLVAATSRPSHPNPGARAGQLSGM